MLFQTIVLGDLHGNRTLLLRALSDLGLADNAGHWTGGTRRLVQVGDMIDRGPEPLETLDLLMRLQGEARAAGGEVTCLLGNHELFALRAAEGQHEARISWAYNGAGADLTQWAARRGLTVDPTDLPYAEEFYADFASDGPYGRWLRTLPAAVRVGDYVAVHAGWTPDGPDTIEAANAALAAGTWSQIYNLVWARRQPEAEIAAACERLGCRGLIAGHSIKPGIETSVGGQLIQIDVGMWYVGTWAAVGIDPDGAAWALVEGQEPVRIEGDGLIAVPQPAPADRPQQAPRYTPGDLLRVYLANDYSEYLYVEGFGEYHGAPAYTGRLLNQTASGWTVRPSTYFCERVDRFSRPAAPGEVPDHLLE